MSRRDDILTKVRAVEKMPTSIQQALSLLRDPNADMMALARILEHDPGLTANILRVANSAYFGGREATSSVKDSIMRLGLERVMQVVLSAGIAPRARLAIKGYDLAPCKLLEHSITTAVAAEEIGRALGLRTPEYVFTAGLLCKIGKTVLGTFLEVDAKPILDLAKRELLTFDEAEERVLGINHAEVGAVLLEQWGLPADIIEVVRWHLRPEDRPGAPLLALDLVHTGCMLATMIGVGLGLDGMNYQPSTVVTERLGLTPQIMDKATAEIMDKVAELWDIFANCG
jgi:putative nucleotidyltransferase with HDIG domain